MVEQDHNELTQAEAELYDRQIRLWGLENQKRYVRRLLLICYEINLFIFSKITCC